MSAGILARPAWEIAAAVRGGGLSATAVTEAALDRIARLNPVLNAFTDVTADRARREAAELDARIAAGADPGPLAGVPVAVKNLFDIGGLPTRAGSRINRDRPPATADAVLLRRLTAAGAVLVGGLNMGEYAYDFTGENAHDGACRNPHDPSRMAGGSSSGCGAATAAGLAPLSLGSDTNGSIRVPSSFCGIFGLKPTYGRLTRHGSFPFCDSLDHLGPFARSVRDLALAYDVLQGPAEGDHACAGRPVEPALPALDASGLDGLRIAVAGGYFARGGQPEAHDAVARAAQALGTDRVVELPGAELGRAAAYIITNAESSAFHLERLRTRAGDFDPDTRDRFLAGALLPAAWYVQAQRVRRWYHDRVMALFREVDVLLAPATPCTAPLVGRKTMVLDGREMPVRPHLGLFTQPISCIGLPVCAVPMAPPGAPPIGIQVIAAPWREETCLRVAAELERLGLAQAPLAEPVGL
ncbi:aspartyl-tRNA(Asn)/glutamyl-tRNA (Gln) amidotransferase subunit A (plasmid) [Azospirillum sp. B510]|uniref:AtzE family amidohydrolase n=1 Tax=Azospirillum sp. (strain B510) TaxID=137722 RepID=UPI0001C4BBED|nr:AtzE family amidohydrolase [Azospirillum sp. B510]BAI74439.1 aspartyl-tRNA(Asn)/glutamyl-tRNA (Gln) amidotransferase subunit A [Azospirillum sp. B510]